MRGGLAKHGHMRFGIKLWFLGQRGCPAVWLRKVNAWNHGFGQQFSSPTFYRGKLGGRFGYFLSFSAPGRGRGSPERQEGGGSVFNWKSQEGGGLPIGEGAGRESAGNLGGVGGGYIFFNRGEKKTNKHKQFRGIVPEVGGGQIVYVFPFSWGKRETHKQNSHKVSGKGWDSPGTIPGNFCLCVFLFIGFFPALKKGSTCCCSHSLSASICGDCSQVLVSTSVWGAQEGVWQWRFSCYFSLDLDIFGSPHLVKQGKNAKNDKSTLFHPTPHNPHLLSLLVEYITWFHAEDHIPNEDLRHERSYHTTASPVGNKHFGHQVMWCGPAVRLAWSSPVFFAPSDDGLWLTICIHTICTRERGNRALVIVL